MPRMSRAWRQWLWFAALWAAGVATLFVVALPIRWLLKAG